MAITTSIVIPIDDAHWTDAICQVLESPFILTPYSEEKVLRVVESRKWMIFKKKILTTHAIAKGTKFEIVNQLVSSVIEKQSNYQLLGHLNEKVYEGLISEIKTVGDIGDWQPWDFSVQHDYEGSWGDEIFSYKGLCFVVSGYGNPMGSGSPFAKAVASAKYINYIVDKLGKMVPHDPNSKCSVTVNSKTLYADLDC